MSDPTHEPLPRPRRRWWISVLLSLVIFVAGGVVGGAVTLLVVVRGVQHAIQHPEEAPDRITARLTRRLDLTDEQADQVRTILRQRQANLQAIRRRVWPEVEAELARTREQVADVLTPEQRRQWHAWFNQARNHWWFPAPPPPQDHDNADEAASIH